MAAMRTVILRAFSFAFPMFPIPDRLIPSGKTIQNESIMSPFSEFQAYIRIFRILNSPLLYCLRTTPVQGDKLVVYYTGMGKRLTSILVKKLMRVFLVSFYELNDDPTVQDDDNDEGS
jgi:hypothetical protein